MLKPHLYRRSVELPNRERAVDLLWPIPSDDRPKHGAEAWAAVRVVWSPPLRQMVPTVMRLYTRRTGMQREIMATSVTLMKLALPASGPDDSQAESKVAICVQAALPELMASDPIVGKIFPAADVLR